MGHFIGPEVTSGTTPAVHAGLNYKFAQFTLAETASASVTVAICNLPAGAQVAGCHLTVDSDALDTTGAGSVSVKTWTGGNDNGAIVQTAAASTLEFTYNPEHEANGYRHTSSSHVVVKLSNFAATGTGTATNILSVTVVYAAMEDGD